MAEIVEEEISKEGRSAVRSMLGRHRWLVALGLLVVAAVGALVGYALHPGEEPSLKIFGATKTFGEARELFPKQLAFFLGQDRPADSLLYGEWVRRRFSKQCRGLDPEDMSFTAAMEGPFKSGGFRWYVLATHDGLLPAGCDPKRLLVTIGALMSRTGEIIALSPDAGIGSTRLPIVVDDGGASLATPTPDAADAWWTRFLAGEDP